jgi:hypothetical protein
MEEIKYLFADFIDRFNVTEPPAKKQMIKEGRGEINGKAYE